MDSKKIINYKKKNIVRKNLPLDPETLDCDCNPRKDVRPPVVKTSRDDGPVVKTSGDDG